MVLALTLSLAMAADPPPTPGAPATLGGSAAGRALFEASCTACHGTTGNGKGPAAIALKPKPPDFTAASFWANRTDAQVAQSIRIGRPGTPMAPFPGYSDAELADLVATLRSFAPVAP